MNWAAHCESKARGTFGHIRRSFYVFGQQRKKMNVLIH